MPDARRAYGGEAMGVGKKSDPGGGLWRKHDLSRGSLLERRKVMTLPVQKSGSAMEGSKWKRPLNEEEKN